jgi:MFS transporter, DHA3 family, macrolide efflux protein
VQSLFDSPVSIEKCNEVQPVFKRNSAAPGMQTFVTIWFGQLVSILGSAMTRFALLIWAYEQTGSATTVALLGFFSFIPFVLISPLAGVWIDRLDRRRILLFADLAAGLMTLAMLVLFKSGNLQIWHLYIAEALTGAFESFQIPAYHAATTTLIPKTHYARASGMRSLAQDASRIFAPVLAGMLLNIASLDTVMLVDIATFLVALFTLLRVRIPRPAVSAEGIQARGNTRQEMLFGFRYILTRRGLFALVLIFGGINFFASLTYFAILPAMILSRSGGSEITLAAVQAALGIGGIVGGVWVSTRGGPKRYIHGILGGAALSFLFGDLLFAVGRTPVVWVMAGLITAIFIPFILSSNRALWQNKVAPDVQGRVFSVQATIQELAMPLGYLIAGPLADQVFEPAMQTGGALTDTFSWLVGVGPGAGMGLMFACTAFLGLGISLAGYLIPAIRNVEDDLPDHDAEPETASAPDEPVLSVT